MHFDTATRQRWMRVLAHSQPAALSARMNALSLAPGYDILRAPEIGLVQIQARMGGTGERFFAGDATLTRAAIRLHSGTLGYSYVLGRDRHAPEAVDLRWVGAIVTRDGAVEETGLGAGVLNDPVESVLWLARRMAAYGMEIRPGDAGSCASLI